MLSPSDPSDPSDRGTLRRRTGGVQALGLLAGLAIPGVATSIVVARFSDFVSWRPDLSTGLGVLFGAAGLICLGWGIRAVRLSRDRMFLGVDGLEWTESGASRRARRSDLEVRGRRVLQGPNGRWIERFALQGTDAGDQPVDIDLDRWTLVGVSHRSRPSVAHAVSGWIRHGNVERGALVSIGDGPEPLRPAPSPSWSGQPAPSTLVWFWFLFGLATPVVSWFWIVARTAPNADLDSMPRAVAYFWLLLVFLLVLQPVIAKVVRSRRDMLLMGFGPALALGATHVFSPFQLPSSSGDVAGFPPWLLWMAEAGTVHLLTVMLAFAVIAYVAPFSTGAFLWWQPDDLKFFVFRGVVALLILIPALFYGRLLVVESLEALQAQRGSGWHALAWMVAVATETGTVLQRMLRGAAL